MSNQVFGVRPLGNCLQIVPLPTFTPTLTLTPTPTPCINQSDICIQQLQNFLNVVKPGGGCVLGTTVFEVSVAVGDLTTLLGFLDPTLDYRTQFILTLSDIPSQLTFIVNLIQVGVIFTAYDVDDVQCIIDQIPSTFNRCQDPPSLAAQQLEAAATALIDAEVTIFSENTNAFSIEGGVGGFNVTIRAVKPGIIIATAAGQVYAFSTCFVSAIQIGGIA